jgi:hypothetical protein
VPRHVARLVTRLVAPLIVDYSSSTTSSPPRVRVPRHVARLATRLVAPLIVDYFASRRLIVDYSVRHDFVLRQHCLYFEYAARRHDVIFPGRITPTIHLD